MAGSRVPGPAGTDTHSPVIDPGTSALAATPTPGSVGTEAVAAPSAAAAVVENDSEIEALDLASVARTAAYALKKAHPAVKFTSGRRAKADQARAMASNVVTNRKWIEETYKSSTLRTSLQTWVNDNADKKTQAEIQTGLLSVFNAADATELGKFSKHLSGMAFDVQPVTENAEAIKTTLRGLAGIDLFLDTEGGLVRWHAQF